MEQQTKVELFILLEQIKQQELSIEDLDELINIIVDYKSDLEKQYSDLYHAEEEMKREYIEESIL